ncbi:hypothetical protein HZF24_14590 [Sedimentibacter hydroxybenzoicus DSM 7310]|uniref:Uncharacterized protein n=1 Tax=Sedimentibacter hydroxybenzoicus DSM 7310 TaxID=1123245 RepID=A0A974BLW6_SEDHY|nr:hypothetical protein [Sedimentibacter hydroxybenzoicus]NYB75373.1 hypothetical protein [Sedimentibacter hydroxybenzoicus DSM 7310]
MKRTNNFVFIILCLIILIFAGCSKNEEENAQQVAKDFISDLYTVSSEEVGNYSSLKNASPSEAMELDLNTAVHVNDDILKSLMTEDGYEVLLKNRQNLKFTEICYRENFTMQVTGIQLSENYADIDNNEADYSFEVNLKLISDDSTETEGTAKGKLLLSKTDDNWKIAGYRQGTFPDFLK